MYAPYFSKIGRWTTRDRVNPASFLGSGRGALNHATLTPDIMMNTVVWSDKMYRAEKNSLQNIVKQDPGTAGQNS